MKHFFRLVRFKNLLIIALTIIIMKYLILIPVYEYYETELFFSNTGFLFLCISIILIAAAGNIINDYFDRKTDLINRPSKVVVVLKIKRRTAILLHLIFSIIGILFGFIASYYAGSILYGLFFIFMVFVLWKYSTILKRTVFWGNFSVAILTGIPAAIVALSEYLAFKNSGLILSADNIMAIKVSTAFLFGFALFAIVYNFIREIVKDLEDIKGDSVTGVKTLAIKLGCKKANRLVSALLVIAGFSVIFVWNLFIMKLPFLNDNNFTTIYIWVLIIVPTLFLAVKSLLAAQKKDYTYMSKLLKIIMIIGVLFSVLISIMINGLS